MQRQHRAVVYHEARQYSHLRLRQDRSADVVQTTSHMLPRAPRPSTRRTGVLAERRSAQGRNPIGIEAKRKTTTAATAVGKIETTSGEVAGVLVTMITVKVIGGLRGRNNLEAPLTVVSAEPTSPATQLCVFV